MPRPSRSTIARQGAVLTGEPAPRRKYGNEPVTIGGMRFASKREAARYATLLYAEMAGEISDLECQPRFRLEVNGVKVCEYRGDFRYRRNGQVVIEDVKGMRLPLYRLKVKLMKVCLGIEVLET